MTFQAGGLGQPAALQVGERVQVTYRQTPMGTLVATTLAYPGEVTATGVVSALAADGSSLTVQAGDGSTITLVTAGAVQLLDGVAPGDTVQVGYVRLGGALVPVTLVVTATPGATATPAPTAIPAPSSPSAVPGEGGARG